VSKDALAPVLAAARIRRDKGDFRAAIRLFRKAEQIAPAHPGVKHNLALACLSAGEYLQAAESAQAALRLSPQLWQSQVVLAKAHSALRNPVKARAIWSELLSANPQNAFAILGLADLALNEFGDPQASSLLAERLLPTSEGAEDALLTRLMADLYLGRLGDVSLSRQFQDYSREHLRLSRPAQKKSVSRAKMKRVGFISTLFQASPVYYLCYSALRRISEIHHVTLFMRSAKADWATGRFLDLASEVRNVASLGAADLAATIEASEIDVLFDLSGWTDPEGLRALSCKPAVRMYKWIGGQSITTGLEAFDGWIGDEWHCPKGVERLYSEPLIRIEGGYCDYSPPEYLAASAASRRKGTGLVSNPAKIGEGSVAAWPEGVDRVTLIDRRYAHEETRLRVEELLRSRGIRVEDVIVPGDHKEYLEAIGSLESVVNTAPYALGLTAVEALSLDVRVLYGKSASDLFSSRHHFSHLHTRGRNSALAAELLELIDADADRL